jgi:hypothetical protein
VHAVVGGWHLAPYPDEIIAKTVEALKEINPDYLIPMHCTGFRTMMAVQQKMPQKPHYAFHGHERGLRRLAPIPPGRKQSPDGKVRSPSHLVGYSWITGNSSLIL